MVGVIEDETGDLDGDGDRDIEMLGVTAVAQILIVLTS